MASYATVTQCMGKALWDPTPTINNDIAAQQLAMALGYPVGWRVVRTIENDILDTTTTAGQQETTADKDSKKETDQPHEDKGKEEQGSKPVKPEAPETTPSVPVEPTLTDTNNNSTTPLAPESTAKPNGVTSAEKIVKDTTCNTSTTEKPIRIIVDRIFAGAPDTDCDMWYHHAGAMKAAAIWNDQLQESLSENAATATKKKKNSKKQGKQPPTPYFSNGGHLMPRQAKFQPGDTIFVLYGDTWYHAKILRKQKDFKYQVYYTQDSSKESNVVESRIRARKKDSSKKSKKRRKSDEDESTAALEANDDDIVEDEDDEEYGTRNTPTTTTTSSSSVGDPPWRTTGHEYLQRQVQWRSTHPITSRRTLELDQVGTVTGWIAATDVDSAGQPAFVSQQTNEPAALFHVEFNNDDPNTHPHGSYLLQSVDLEEYEVVEHLMAKEETAVQKSKTKKQRVR